METFFNLVWLVTCCVSLFLWWRQFKQQGSSRYVVKSADSLLFLLFVLALLFPVISVTDDLQVDLSFLEASLQNQESSKVLIKAAVSAAPAALWYEFLLIVLSLATIALAVFWRSIQELKVPLWLLLPPSAFDRRPPPVLASL